YTSDAPPLAQSDTTDVNGFYQFPMAGHGNAVVTPRDFQTTSDPECSNAINSSDASRASQIAVSIPPAPTPNQRVAGDVSNNGAVTAFDASLIAQKATAPSCTGFMFPVETATGSDWA